LSRADSAQAKRIDSLLAFLREFESDTPIGEWRGGDRNADGSITVPYFEPSDFLLRFRAACSAGGWVRSDFDWGAWQDEAIKYVQDPDLLAQADVDTIERLLTLHIRRDRFNDGHLAWAVESGHIIAILRRLQDIRRPALSA
jgi:hypothetical protein